MGRRIIPWILIAAVFLLGGPASSAPPDRILLAIKNIKPSNPAVPFDHKMHIEKVEGCRTCHHRDDVVLGQKCSGCHGSNSEIMKVCMRQAFHRMCTGCHRAIKAGPTKCTGCHLGEPRFVSQTGP
jgi:hypothetical protein